RREPAEKRGEMAAVPAHSRSESRNPKSETGELPLIFRISDFVFRISEPRAEHEPAAQIDAGREQQCGQEPGVEQPGAQGRIERGTHGYCLPPVGRVAGSAGGAPRGRRFSRNSTRAVISAGLICLPYAGMLPPPGVPLLIWSINWSRVSRVPTAVRSGPRW